MDERSEFIIPPMALAHDHVAKYNTSASWEGTDVCFNVTNYAYPFPHLHEYYEIFIVLRGTMVHRINGLSYPVHRGDCCLVRPDDYHYFEDDPEQANSICLNVNFMCQPAFMEEITRSFGVDCLNMLLSCSQPLSFSVSNTVVPKIEQACLLIQSPEVHPTDNNLMICKSIIIEPRWKSLPVWVTKVSPI